MNKNNYNMVDIIEKSSSKRIAIAKGEIQLCKESYSLIKQKQLPKGDAIAMAEISAIMAAKNTSLILPLCHPIKLECIEIRHEFNDSSCILTFYTIVGCVAKTGVEMEALTATQAALLTVYDLAKMVTKNLFIKNTELLFKMGGKSGLWLSNSPKPEWINHFIEHKNKSLNNILFAIITVSDRAFSKTYQDESGEIVKNYIKNNNGIIVHYEVVPDERQNIQAAIQNVLKKEKNLILFTSGGTGLSQRDITPDCVKEISSREIKGFGEMIRLNGSEFTPFSWLSRASAFDINGSLVICLPGSPKAIKENMDSILPILPHAISIMKGKNHDQL